MSMIMIRCPNTGREAPTGIETDPASYRALPNKEMVLKCPVCGQDHTWTLREAWLSGAERSLPPIKRQ